MVNNSMKNCKKFKQRGRLGKDGGRAHINLYVNLLEAIHEKPTPVLRPGAGSLMTFEEVVPRGSISVGVLAESR
jgi:hypothetical protein